MADDPAFSDFDFFLAKYPTSLGFSAHGNNVRFTPVAEGLNQRLQSEVVPNYASVHLIGHSMGGNMILTSLLFLKFRYTNAHEILNKYLNIILLGTPVEGADIANLARLVSSDEKLIALKPVVENELPVLTELALDNIDAKRQVLGLPRLLISSGYEKKPMLHSVIIVNERRATAVASAELPDTEMGFERDHISLVKPKDQNDPVYKWVREQIQHGIDRGSR
jgi:hypothetical protein